MTVTMTVYEAPSLARANTDPPTKDPNPSKADHCHLCSSSNDSLFHCILCNRPFCSVHSTSPTSDSEGQICPIDHRAYKDSHKNFPRVFGTRAAYDDMVEKWKERETRYKKELEDLEKEEREKEERDKQKDTCRK